MVSRVIPHADLMATAREVLAQCCRTAPHARAMIKSSLDNYLGLYDRIGMKVSLDGPEARGALSPSSRGVHRIGCIPRCASTVACSGLGIVLYTKGRLPRFRCSRLVVIAAVSPPTLPKPL